MAPCFEAIYTLDTFTVTYKADGVTVGEVQTVALGGNATAPQIPEKTGYTQTPPTWNHNGKSITEDTVIEAVYTPNTYTVTYKADGVTVGALQTVKHGENATAPEIPAKVGYTETAPVWDHNGENITKDTVINAVYTKNDPGEYGIITPEANYGGGKLDEDSDSLKNKIPFTQDEREKIEQGQDVGIWIELTDISDSIANEDKEKISELLSDDTLAFCLDITMFKQVGNDQATRLTQLSDKVKICFTLPASYINTNESITRTYGIIYIHNGEADSIIPTFDAETNTLSFETDRFSTYAVVYSDNAPQSGSILAKIAIWLIPPIAIAAIVTVVLLVLKKRKASKA